MRLFKFFMVCIVASLSLATIFSCSTVRKTKVEKKVEIADKKTTTIDSVASSVVEKEETKIVTTDKTEEVEVSNLEIIYEPTYDTKGDIIPFTYEKEKDGKKTKITITGNAKVKDNSTTTNKKETDQQVEQNTNKETKLDAVKSDSKEESKTTIEETIKNKEKKPDYLKYAMWICLGLVLLSAIIVGIKLYLKSVKKSINPFN